MHFFAVEMEKEDRGSVNNLKRLLTFLSAGSAPDTVVEDLKDGANLLLRISQSINSGEAKIEQPEAFVEYRKRW
jgi:hypothetical protein